MPASSKHDAASGRGDSLVFFLFIAARDLSVCGGNCSAAGTAFCVNSPAGHAGSIPGMATEKHVSISIDPAIVFYWPDTQYEPGDAGTKLREASLSTCSL